MCKAAAPSSFALISLISVMRAASSAAANAAATGRNDAAAAVPMTARRPSGRAGVWSAAEVPTSSVTARVVSMKTRPEPSGAPRRFHESAKLKGEPSGRIPPDYTLGFRCSLSKKVIAYNTYEELLRAALGPANTARFRGLGVWRSLLGNACGR